MPWPQSSFRALSKIYARSFNQSDDRNLPKRYIIKVITRQQQNEHIHTHTHPHPHPPHTPTPTYPCTHTPHTPTHPTPLIHNYPTRTDPYTQPPYTNTFIIVNTKCVVKIRTKIGSIFLFDLFSSVFPPDRNINNWPDMFLKLYYKIAKDSLSICSICNKFRVLNIEVSI